LIAAVFSAGTQLWTTRLTKYQESLFYLKRKSCIQIEDTWLVLGVEKGVATCVFPNLSGTSKAMDTVTCLGFQKLCLSCSQRRRFYGLHPISLIVAKLEVYRRSKAFENKCLLDTRKKIQSFCSSSGNVDVSESNNKLSGMDGILFFPEYMAGIASSTLYPKGLTGTYVQLVCMDAHNAASHAPTFLFWATRPIL